MSSIAGAVTDEMTTKQPSEKSDSESAGQRLRLLSYNIQTGSSTTRYRHYVTQSWKHLLPSTERVENLGRIAHMIADYDLVGLQEVDAGSLRSGFINQTEYLADRAKFPFWYHQTNRSLGKIAQHSNGFMSRFRPTGVEDHKLPGTIPGRGALSVRFGGAEESLIVVILHLALGRRSRMRQLDYISEVTREHDHTIVMGDMNCRADSTEMKMLHKKANLTEPLSHLHTFPSWRPERSIDHILVSPEIRVEKAQVLNHTFSDHLPVSVELVLPRGVRLAAG